MIYELPSIIFVDASISGNSIGFPASEQQQIEILKVKPNEAIRHINVLEEKLLSSEDLKGLGTQGVDVTGGPVVSGLGPYR